MMTQSGKLRWWWLAIVILGTSSTANSQAAPEAMQFVECDFEKTVQVYGFRETPRSVVDGLNSALALEVFEVSDSAVRFAYENPFQAIALYAIWDPKNADAPPVTGLTVEINRLTGGGQLTFSRPPTEAEKAECGRDKGWCDDDITIGSVTGQCRAVSRRF